MRKVVGAGALGVANAQGFYKYTPQEARRWEKRFLDFSYDIRALAQKYSQKPTARRSGGFTLPSSTKHNADRAAEPVS
jgi:3-hydroxyacyl-CoA dehydrogenase